ncbi:PREDICTED: uncharacterized protein LOC105141982 isoform X1 [Populus euphratica]|uniref:Uncharacterized protein LOC105141982 isoform X1 n=1 Tax=Populus euphratica TaxID=75702 RepID=A0AAJ6VGY6_POPEU|nr:PREDICTED: uncharacterized protein LOC105141982 isoform X1 [Populus euphratica]
MMMKMNLESILKTHMEITLKNQTLRMMVLFCQREKVLTFMLTLKHLLDEALSKCHQVDSFPSLEDFLAEQLAKVDVSGRLFIEADLLATELGSNKSSSQEYDQLQTTGSEASSSHGPD